MKLETQAVTYQKAARLLLDSPTKCWMVKAGYKVIVTMNGRQWYLQWTGVRYEVEPLPKQW